MNLYKRLGSMNISEFIIRNLIKTLGNIDIVWRKRSGAIGTPANHDVLPFEKIKSSILFYNLILVITRLLIG